MQWINVRQQLPKENQDVLISDGQKQWVASFFNNIWLSSHPDYKRNPHNEYGCPYVVLSKPTHWMPLPKPPQKNER